MVIQDFSVLFLQLSKSKFFSKVFFVFFLQCHCREQPNCYSSPLPTGASRVCKRGSISFPPLFTSLRELLIRQYACTEGKVVMWQEAVSWESEPAHSTYLLLPNIFQANFTHTHTPPTTTMLWSECLCLPQNSYIEILTPNMMVLGGQAFGRWLGHEGRSLMNGIKVLIKEAPQSPLTSFSQET